MSTLDAAPAPTSTRPYLLRAIYEWCADNGFTPYVAAHVDDSVQVPREHVKNNEIVLNISMDATSGLKLGNDYIEFKARFGGVARDIIVPIDHVIAIYARENGQGMAFPMPQSVPPRGDVTSAPRAAGKAAVRTDKTDRADSPGLHAVSPVPVSSTTKPAKVVALATGASEDDARSADDSAQPEPPPQPPKQPNGAGKPTLKRIK
jgi:stringent starvation protein B